MSNCGSNLIRSLYASAHDGMSPQHPVSYSVYRLRFFALRDLAFFEVNLALMVPFLGLRLGESARLAALPPVRTGVVDSPREV